MLKGGYVPRRFDVPKYLLQGKFHGEGSISFLDCDLLHGNVHFVRPGSFGSANGARSACPSDWGQSIDHTGGLPIGAIPLGVDMRPFRLRFAIVLQGDGG